MAKSIKLKCTANAYFDGELIKAGAVQTFPEDEAKRLLSSGRFESAPEDKPAKKTAKKGD